MYVERERERVKYYSEYFRDLKKRGEEREGKEEERGETFFLDFSQLCIFSLVKKSKKTDKC